MQRNGKVAVVFRSMVLAQTTVYLLPDFFWLTLASKMPAVPLALHQQTTLMPLLHRPEVNT
jgi:hypothetical protein